MKKKKWIKKLDACDSFLKSYAIYKKNPIKGFDFFTTAKSCLSSALQKTKLTKANVSLFKDIKNVTELNTFVQTFDKCVQDNLLTFLVMEIEIELDL